MNAFKKADTLVIVAEMYYIYTSQSICQHDMDLHIYVHIAKARICWMHEAFYSG